MRAVLSILLFLAPLGSVALGADPKDFPQRDVEIVCGARQRFGDERQQNRSFNSCIEENEAAYRFLQSVWPMVSDEVFRNCSKYNSDDKNRQIAYELWAQCVFAMMQREEILKGSLERRKFQP